MNDSKEPIGRPFGQQEPLTTRLKGLVRSYPKGLGLFKEFIQNADDAEADEIVFVIDEQQYETSGLPESMRWLHTGPAMLVYNNKPFSDEDIDGIQALGHLGGKGGPFALDHILVLPVSRYTLARENALQLVAHRIHHHLGGQNPRSFSVKVEVLLGRPPNLPCTAFMLYKRALRLSSCLVSQQERTDVEVVELDGVRGFEVQELVWLKVAVHIRRDAVAVDVLDGSQRPRYLKGVPQPLLGS